MLTRCRKGLIIVSSKSFLRGGGRSTLLGKLEQAWVDWTLVAEGKCRLPHLPFCRDTVTTGRTEVYSGPTPTAERQRTPYNCTTTSETPRTSLPVQVQPSTQTAVNDIAPPTSPPQASVPIQPPLKVSCIEERQRSPYNHMTISEPPRPMLEQTSKQTVVNHGAPPTSPPQASVPIQPPLTVSGTEERQGSTYNQETTSEAPRPVLEQQTVVNHKAPPTSPPEASVPIQPPRKVSGTEERPTSNYATTSETPRHMYNHTPVQMPRQNPDASDEDPSTDRLNLLVLAEATAAIYFGFTLLKPH